MLLILHVRTPVRRRVPAAGSLFSSAAEPADAHEDLSTLCRKKSSDVSKEPLLLPTPLPATRLPPVPTFSYAGDTGSCTGLLVLTHQLALRGFTDTKAQKLSDLHKSQEYTSSLSIPVISHTFFFPNLLHIELT